MTKYQVFLEPDLEEGGFVAHCPALLGCYSEGETKEEALANINEAIQAYLESMQKYGIPMSDAH